jgi:putative hydrolase of the HAD superfamily
MPIRAVLLDAVGTLIYADPPVATAYANAARSCGVQVGIDEIRGRFAEAFAFQEQLDRQLGQATDPQRERQRWQQIVDFVFRDAAPVDHVRERIFAALWDHFALPESWRAYEDAADCLDLLLGRGLTVAVASNFDERLAGIARQLDPLNRVERVFISAQIGHRKPGLEFFRSIERELSLLPNQLLSVGDHFENDIAGAKAAGWHAIWLDRAASSHEQSSDAISSLRDLESRL